MNRADLTMETKTQFPKEIVWQVTFAELNKYLCQLLATAFPLPVSAQFISFPHTQKSRDYSFTFMGSILAIFLGSVFLIMAFKGNIHMGEPAALMTGGILAAIGLLGAFFSYPPPPPEIETDRKIRHGLIFTRQGLLVSLDQKFCWIPRSNIETIKYVRPRKESSDHGLWFFFKDKTNWKLSSYSSDYRLNATPLDVKTWFEKGCLPPFEEIYLKKLPFHTGSGSEKEGWARLPEIDNETLAETEIKGLGLRLIELSPEEKCPPENPYNAGVKVVGVKTGSFADENLDPGDIIIGLNQKSILNINDFSATISETGKKDCSHVTFTIRRHNY